MAVIRPSRRDLEVAGDPGSWVWVSSESDRPAMVLTRTRLGAPAAGLGAALVAGLIAWLVSGRGAAVPLVAVGVLAMEAGVVDARSLRIPNRTVLAAAAVVVAGIPFVAVVDHRGVRALFAAAGVGVVLSGAVWLFAVWLVRPGPVGGGDWKLLAILGAAVGVVAPLAAPLILLVATLGQVGQSTVRQRRANLPLGPGLAAGYLVAVSTAVLAADLFGGFYS